MPRCRCGALFVLLLAAVLLPSPAFAWGFTAHKYIMRRAIDLLPPALKPLFVEHRDEVVMRVVDPDLWRNVGWDDDPNHFVNFGAPELGPYPFTAFPREHGAALEKFGIAALNRLGTLPWREAEEFGNLRRTFEGFARGNAYGASDAILFAAVASHYIQDAHQPLHASNNYDGQLTDQRGIHSRFERDLVERYESRLVVNPVPPRSVPSARDAAFEALLASHQLVAPLLAADKEAIGGRDAYDDVYFEAFFQKVKPMLEERLGAAITATASMIVSAWEQAGKPDLKNGSPRPIQRVQRAQTGQQAR
jgi:hypothetical protein